MGFSIITNKNNLEVSPEQDVSFGRYELGHMKTKSVQSRIKFILKPKQKHSCYAIARKPPERNKACRKIA